MKQDVKTISQKWYLRIMDFLNIDEVIQVKFWTILDINII